MVCPAHIVSVQPQEEGQCGFFQWQDQPAENSRKHPNLLQDRNQAYGDGAEERLLPKSSSQTLQCHCGLEPVEFTSHSAANPDRVFYRCPNSEVQFHLCPALAVL